MHQATTQRRRTWASVALAGAMLLSWAGLTYGQDQPAAGKELHPQAKPAPDKGKADPKFAPQQPAAPKTPAPSQRAARAPRGSTGFEMDPDAQWFCEKVEQSQPPIWRGEKGVTFTFFIENRGTAPLKIRAKGG